MAFFEEVLSDLLKPPSTEGTNDAFGRLERDAIRARFAKALRMEHGEDPIAEGDPTKCGSCGKMLYEDDPELTRKGVGRVCMSWFQCG